jgi:hypothetical protein
MRDNLNGAVGNLERLHHVYRRGDAFGSVSLHGSRRLLTVLGER